MNQPVAQLWQICVLTILFCTGGGTLAFGLAPPAQAKNQFLAHPLPSLAFGRPFSSVEQCLDQVHSADNSQGRGGIEKICEALWRSWQKEPTENQLPSTLTNSELGTLTIDLIDGNNRGSVSANAFAQLLATPHLLPPRLSGGLILQNAEFSTPLVLDNITIGFPVSLFNVKFSRGLASDGSGNEYALKADDTEMLASLRIKESVIDGPVQIQRSNFHDVLIIEDSTLSSNQNRPGLYIEGSNFEGGIILRNTVTFSNSIKYKPISEIPHSKFTEETLNLQPNLGGYTTSSSDDYLRIHQKSPIYCNNTSEISDAMSVQMLNNSIEPHLYIHWGDFGSTVDISANKIGSLYFTGSNSENATNHLCFRGGLSINSNQIGSLDFVEAHFSKSDDRIMNSESHMRPSSYIIENEISGGLVIWRVALQDHSLTVNSNKVGGRFEYYPLDVATSEKESIIDLTFNQVQGLGRIILPDHSNQHSTSRSSNLLSNHSRTLNVKLSGSEFANRLIIEEANEDGAPHNPDFSHHWALHPEEIHRIKSNADNCERDAYGNITSQDKTIIVFDMTEIAALSWLLKEVCTYRWQGRNLRYEFWGEPTLTHAVLTRGKTSSGQQDWQGVNVEQRDKQTFLAGLDLWLKEFSETKTPDEYFYAAEYVASAGEFTFSRDLRQDAKRLDYLPLPLVYRNSVSDLIAYPFEWLRWLLLWPTGFGAKPEWALILNFGLFGFFGTIYQVYSIYCLKSGKYAGQGWMAERGFLAFDPELHPREFSLWRYSLDASLPFINLHAYDRFIPKEGGMRIVPIIHHILAWYLLTIFVASAAVL